MGRGAPTQPKGNAKTFCLRHNANLVVLVVHHKPAKSHGDKKRIRIPHFEFPQCNNVTFSLFTLQRAFE